MADGDHRLRHDRTLHSREPAHRPSQSRPDVRASFSRRSPAVVALGLMATAAHIGTAFYALALTLLSTLAFVGLVTFNGVLQNGLEDLNYANRIARLRAFYFDHARTWMPIG
jgi:hypothetical protein